MHKLFSKDHKLACCNITERTYKIIHISMHVFSITCVLVAAVLNTFVWQWDLRTFAFRTNDNSLALCKSTIIFTDFSYMIPFIFFLFLISSLYHLGRILRTQKENGINVNWNIFIIHIIASMF